MEKHFLRLSSMRIILQFKRKFSEVALVGFTIRGSLDLLKWHANLKTSTFNFTEHYAHGVVQ
jgi:hypothetical protein